MTMLRLYAVVLSFGFVVCLAGEARAQPSYGTLRICRLMNLFQMERSGDEVALAVGTTGWNAGQVPLDWHRRPDARHPFIAQALYRLHEDRLEQIGIAGVKHGYYVAAAPGCDGQACQGPSGQVLHPSCNDTYGAATNGGQRDMGPRYEVNPWTGAWAGATGHTETPHQHDPLTHRLRVRDQDLDPMTHSGARYFIEAYYIHHQNADPATAAAWRPVTVRGVAGGEWTFEMDDAAPTPGFAISAWPGATLTQIAQALPVERGRSNDGRALLATKIMQLAPNSWRYEYGLFNVDMDRQIQSFSVPLAQGVTIAEPYFSAPRQPDELLNAVGGTAMNDDKWVAQRVGDTLTWSTTTNPLRWGVMYRFGFTSNRPPGDGDIRVGLYKTGTPGAVTARARLPR